MAEEQTGAVRAPDDALLADLRGMLDRLDPPPGWLIELARLSHGLRDLDLSVAEVVADSQTERPAVAVRAVTTSTEPRLLTVEADGLLLDLQVGDGPDGPEVAGQLVPGAPATVELRQPGRPTLTVRADPAGRFTATGLAPGPLALVCRWDRTGVLLSPWLLV